MEGGGRQKTLRNKGGTATEVNREANTRSKKLLKNQKNETEAN